VQSANATNTATDRASLQSEVAELTAEIQRVATQTSFNNTKLLDGSFTSQNFQVGANVGEVISLTSLANVQLASLGQLEQITYTGATQPTLTAVTPADASSLVINGVTVGIPPDASRTTSTASTTALAAALTAAQAEPANASALAGVTMASDGAITSNRASLTIGTAINLTGSVAGKFDGINPVKAAATQGIVGMDISTTEGATAAITAMDTALSAINTARGTMGTIQSRFENAISNINVTSENLSAARGRIVDADFAKETSNLSRAQILQQAGTAMVAQANQLPQGVLSLLR
jgi:flagellin